MTTPDRILAALAALLLAGAALRLVGAAEPARVAWPEIPALEAAAAQPLEAEQLDATVAAALAGNVFSTARRTPAARFRLGADGGEAEFAESGETEPLPPPEPPPPPRYRVAGTILDGDGGLALIDADESRSGTELYRVGDAVGGYRLERVAYDHVILIGSTGEVRMDVARPGDAPRTARAVRGPAPNAAPAPEVPLAERATSSEQTPPGAIPRGW